MFTLHTLHHIWIILVNCEVMLYIYICIYIYIYPFSWYYSTKYVQDDRIIFHPLEMRQYAGFYARVGVNTHAQKHMCIFPDSKVHGAKLGPIWAQCWPHDFCYLGISMQNVHIYLKKKYTSSMSVVARHPHANNIITRTSWRLNNTMTS